MEVTAALARQQRWRQIITAGYYCSAQNIASGSNRAAG
jgi:hypothetical protein